MSSGKIRVLSAVSILVILGVILAVLLHRRPPVILKGAVLKLDSDPNKQLPIADVEVTATNQVGTGKGKTDATGFFQISLPKGLRRKQQFILQFRHAGYQPLDLNDYVSDKLYVARMVAIPPAPKPDTHHPLITISNTRVRYTVASTAEADIGSTVKTFQVQNIGNRPCLKQPPCSPGGKWKAALEHTSLNAGQGNQFRNARISCIAGPCPFTKIELEDLSQDKTRFNVSVRNWSDTATFLLEAEVVHPMTSNLVRESYPVIFGGALTFSLPPTAEGPSLEADIDGDSIVFPLGPDLFVEWADCHLGVEKDQSKTYRCELKPGYRFK